MSSSLLQAVQGNKPSFELKSHLQATQANPLKSNQLSLQNLLLKLGNKRTSQEMLAANVGLATSENDEARLDPSRKL